jgi:hypothetical protein
MAGEPRRGHRSYVEMNMSTTTFPSALALAILCTLPITGCDTIYGSGRALDETRTVASFDSISVAAGIEADVSPGPSSVVVHGDDNIVTDVVTEVRDSVLYVYPIHDYHAVVPLIVEIHAPRLATLSLSSGSRSTLSEVDEQELALEVDSGATMVASGRAIELRAHVASGGMLDATNVEAERVVIDGHSGGELDLTATREVTGLVESGAHARVLGRPAVRDVHTQSGGDVTYE